MTRNVALSLPNPLTKHISRTLKLCNYQLCRKPQTLNSQTLNSDQAVNLSNSSAENPNNLFIRSSFELSDLTKWHNCNNEDYQGSSKEEVGQEVCDKDEKQRKTKRKLNSPQLMKHLHLKALHSVQSSNPRQITNPQLILLNHL